MKKIKYFIYIILVVGITSCKKDFLDEKPSSLSVIPTTLKDFQSLLDNDVYLGITPGLAELGVDDWYFVDYGAWQSWPYPIERNAYIYQPDIYQGIQTADDWNKPFQQIAYANIVLDGLEKMAIKTDSEWKRVKGSALFLRAYTYHQLAQIFCPAFEVTTANSDLGLPIRLTSDVNVLPQRSTLNETYNRILEDLMEAEYLVENNVDANAPNRVSKPAVHAMLSRVFLSMRNYTSAGLYADKCLQAYNTLIDFNDLNKTSTNPFFINGKFAEIIFLSKMTGSLFHPVRNIAVIEEDLYDSFNSDDLRKELFFREVNGTPFRKASYSNSASFSGLATDEIHLIRAECYAREGNTQAAIQDLNTLLRKRWAKNLDGSSKFIDMVAGSQEATLAKILVERRKELVTRGIRWSDLKRFNKEGANITLTRTLGGETYTLPPNDKRWVYSIPDDEIALSGIQQNDR